MDNTATKSKNEKQKGRFGKFFREVWGEVKKLSWLSKKDLLHYVLAVLAFIAIMALIIYACDLLFGQSMTLIAGL